ncbi:MAG TPA: S8 family serine peptidase [Kiritimatiellia bacterium]|nr:S8 family serine peptidase [Kiritimatiellia bacterium]
MRKFAILMACAMATPLLAAEPLLLDAGRIDTSAPEQQQQFQEWRTARRSLSQKRAASGKAPWIVQFNDMVREEWEKAMTEAGADLRGYLPENAYLVEATPETIAAIGAMDGVYWVGEYLPEYKRARPVREAMARGIAGTRNVNVVVFNPDDAERIGQAIAALPRCAVLLAEPMTDRGLVRASLTAAAMEEVAGWGEVEWIEPYTPKKLCNDVAQGTSKMNVSNAWSVLGLSGAGQTIAVCDTGLDTGNTNTLHRDFTGRVAWVQALGRVGDWSDFDGHGTHVAGSILGSGASSSGKYRGGSYAASLVFQSVLDSSTNLGGIPSDLNVLFRAAYTNGARIHSDSWGSADTGEYTTDSRNTDMWIWSNKTMLVLFAAGNEGIDADKDGVVDLDSLNSPGTAKNCLTVGASENYRTTGGYSTYQYGVDLWTNDYPAEPIKSDYPSSPNSPQGLVAFSSRGPCNDGRIKPDIVAPGSDIISTRSKASTDTGWGTVSGNTNYIYMGGTSMATPLTAGSAGLVRQWLVNSAGITNPSAALMKAVLICGARHMAPGQYGTGADQEIPYTRPNNVMGWGHVDLYNTLQPAASQYMSLYDTNSLVTGGTNIFTFTVGSTTTNKIVVTMAYSDYFATAGSGKKLVNDLDLTVLKPSSTTLYANGRTSVDATNNVEMVEFEPNETGTYTVRVVGRTVPSGGSQPYALVIRGWNAAAGDSFDVSSSGSFSPAGPAGGPFAPTSTVYSLTNSGVASLNWTAVKGAGLTWLDLSRTNGTLAAGTATSVSFMVNAATAASLATGLFSGTVTFSNVTSGATVSRSAALTVRGISQLIWNSVSSPQLESTPFVATLTAKDSETQTVTAFAGPVALSGVVSATSTVGTATNGWIFPMSTYYHDARTQVIYLQSELGSATVLQGLALNVATIPGQGLGNWTIRMKHTAASTQSSWEGPASGWTTVYQDDATALATGWTWFAFSTPFSYNGVSNLLVDFSHNNSSYSTDGQVRSSTGAVGRALVCRSDSNDGDPLDWSGTTPTPASTNRVPNIRLLAGASVSISPAATGAFTNGVWSGLITVNETVSSMILRASTNGITGDSNAFAVDAASGTPTLSTLAVSNLAPTSAMSGGNITSDGGASVTQRGVCWSTNSTPTTNDTRTSNGSGAGSYSSSLAGLAPGRSYYVRAYAINANGVGYGSAIGFSADCFTNAPGGLTTGSVAETSFTAAWNALDGALGYRLDVSTSEAFTGGGGGDSTNLVRFEFAAAPFLAPETVAGVVTCSVMSLSSGTIETNVTTGIYFPNEPYIEETGGWTAGSQAGAKYFAFTIYPLTGYSVSITGITFRAYATAAGPSAFSWDIDGGAATHTVNAPEASLVLVNDPVTGVEYKDSPMVVMIQGWTNGSRSTSGTGVFRLDDVQISGTVGIGGGSSYVAGYSDRAVDGTSQSVTGLVASTPYYFRVRAVSDGGCASGNSSTQSVTTSGGGLPAWYTDWAAAQGFDPYGPNGGMDDDYDSDGTPNVDEYTGGTGATNGTSEFAVFDPLLLTPGQYSLTVDVVTGRIYSVYYKTNLTDDLNWSLFKAWTNLPAGSQDLILTNSEILQLYRLGVRVP